MVTSYGIDRHMVRNIMNITKDCEYKWIARISVENLSWLKSFLTQPTSNKNVKRLAWLRLVGLIETWDISE